MPFTLSHPAIVLPFRRYFSTTGLVLGSMSPDFEYFVRMQIKNEIGHSPVGVFLFCLPMSLLFGFIFHGIVRNTLIDNFPIFLKKRCQKFKDFDWQMYFQKNWLKVVFSIIIGAISHIVWDSFTHYDGFMVVAFPALKEVIFGVGLYRILQHCSTFLGGMYIAWLIYHLPQKEVVKEDNRYYWLFVGLLGLMMTGVRFLFLPISIGNIIVTGMMAVFLAMIIISLIKK